MDVDENKWYYCTNAIKWLYFAVFALTLVSILAICTQIKDDDVKPLFLSIANMVS